MIVAEDNYTQFCVQLVEMSLIERRVKFTVQTLDALEIPNYATAGMLMMTEKYPHPKQGVNKSSYKLFGLK